MTNNEQLIQAIVASVDTYATDVTAPGAHTPNAYRIVQELFQEAVRDPWTTDTPRELIDRVETIIMSHTGEQSDSAGWERALGELLNDMDDLADNANE